MRNNADGMAVDTCVSLASWQPGAQTVAALDVQAASLYKL